MIVAKPWLIVIAAIIGVLFALLYYLKSKEFVGVKKRWIYLMALLRFLSSFLITLLLAGIFVKILTTYFEKPVIVFLLDDSKSIKLTYQVKLRDSSQLNQIKEQIKLWQNKLGPNYDSRVFYFDQDLKEQSKWQFNGNYTDISKALYRVKQRFVNQYVGAVVLVSDGIYNRGAEPTFIAQNLGFPIYSVLIGDTTSYKDLKINKVRINKYAFLNNSFPVRVEVVANLLDGAKSNLKIIYDGKEVVNQNIEVVGNYFRKTFDFYIQATSPGKKLIRIQLQPVKSETVVENNYWFESIEVINMQRNILIVSSFPHPDIGAIRRVFFGDKNFKFNFKLLETDEILDFQKYDLVILYQLPVRKKIFPNFFAALKESKKPVLFILGTKTDYFRFNKYGIGVDIFASLTDFNLTYPVANQEFKLFKLPDRAEEVLSHYSPLLSPKGSYRFKGNYEVLLKQKIDGIETELPQIAFLNNSPFNGAKVGIIFGEGIWDWGLQEFKVYKSSEIFKDLMSQIIRYLTVSKERDRFVLTIPAAIEEGRDIEIIAEVYDRNLNFLPDCQILLEVQDSAGNKFNYGFFEQEGFYKTVIKSLPAGKYSYKATAKLPDTTLTKTGQFIVKRINLEALDLKARADLMEKLALLSGGKVLNLNNPQALKQELENQSITKQKFTRLNLTELISERWLFYLILFTLSLEWVLRKYFGSI